MRAIFSVLGLLVVVVVIGLLAKKQLGAGVAPSTATPTESGVAAPTGTPQQQVQQFQRAAQEAMQQAPRAMPDDIK